MRTSSEPSQGPSIQSGCHCVHVRHVILLSKIFCEFSFVVSWTNILPPNFSQVMVYSVCCAFEPYNPEEGMLAVNKPVRRF